MHTNTHTLFTQIHTHKQEHTYHVLENTNRSPQCHGVRNETFYSCPDIRPDTQPLEHTYHVLENTNRSPQCHGVRNELKAFYSCPDSRPDTQPSDPPPIYQTILDERPVEEQLYAQVPSSPLQSINNQSQETGPIYQELSVSTTTGPITTQMSPTVVRTVV